MNEAQRLNKSIEAGKKSADGPGRQTQANVLNWAGRIRHLKAIEKLMLVMMAMDANRNGVCDSPVRWLADDCCINVRHAQKVILQLRDLGLIVIVELNPGSPDRSRIFTLQTMTDPDLWTRPDSVPRSVNVTASYATLSTAKFQESLATVFSEPQLAFVHRTLLLPIQVIGVYGKTRHRLVLQVLHKDTADAVWEHRSAINQAAAIAMDLPPENFRNPQTVYSRRNKK